VSSPDTWNLPSTPPELEIIGDFSDPIRGIRLVETFGCGRMTLDEWFARQRLREVDPRERSDEHR